MAFRFLRRAARRIARAATRYATGDQFELQRPARRSPAAEMSPPGVEQIVIDGITTNFTRAPAYAGIARMLHHVDLGDVVEFGGSAPPLARLLTYRSWNVTPNYPEVDVADLHAYAAASSDTVVLDNILEHVGDPKKALAECARVLRPGGRLVLMLPFLIPVHAAPADYSRWTPEGVRRLLAEHFASVAVESWGNRESLRLMIDFGSPVVWPTIDWAREQLGDSRAWLLLRLNEPEWPIAIWAVAVKSREP
jgi:SAM-dependent methyltransferase